MNVVGGNVPAVGSAFGRVTKSFAHPHRCRKSRRPQLRDDRRGLFVCVFLDHTAMRSDDDKVGLALSVLSHFKEPDTRGLAGGVKYASFDGRLSNSAASPSRSRPVRPVRTTSGRPELS